MKAKRRGTQPTAVTTPEEAFLQAIHANIADPTSWQMYADWLEERGDPNAILYRERQSTNSLGMRFVTVPAGSFWMGGGGGKAGKEQRTVVAFQIGMYPVTQGQWQPVVGNNPSFFSRSGEGKSWVEDVSDEELRAYPAENVSWEDAQAFVKEVNERDRGWLYRLPTEVEWEYACRGAAVSRKECSFHFYVGTPSNSLSSTQANFNGKYPYGKAPRGPYLGRPTRVGSFPGNALGIFDMHGNVWEWCEDFFVGGWPERARRGGSHGDRGYRCQASHRSGFGSASGGSIVGFRLARSAVLLGLQP